MAIAPGTVGPGGAKFGLGAGGPNRYDYTQLGAGLWSVGIDINAPDARQQVDAWMARLSAAERADVMKAVNRDQPGRGAMDAYVYGADARQRDVARKIQKENGFLSSTFGQLLTTALQIGAGFIPGVGPAVSAGIGAVTGGITGGFKGALLGGLSGYGIGKGTQWLANGGLTSLTSSLTGNAASAGGGFTNATALGTGASNGLGLKGTLGAAVGSNGLGLGAQAAASLYTPASLGGAAAAGGSSLLGKIFTASKSPTGQALSTASSIGSTIKKLAAPAATGAALLAAGGMLGQRGGDVSAPTALTSTITSPVSATRPGDYETAREQARAEAAAAVSDNDLIATTPLGVVGKPRTRGKRLLGY